MSLFANRTDAGRQLAEDLLVYADRDPVVLALPRGGVPVAYPVALRLHAPLEIFIVRKVGVPGHAELAMGAIASGGVRVVNEEVVRELRISEAAFNAAANEELQELDRREQAYRQGRPMIPLTDRCVLLIDDGLATGASMLAAVRAVRTQHPESVIVGVPVGASTTCEQLRAEADVVVCHATPRPFGAVGVWYDDFSQTSDQEVRNLLQQAAAMEARSGTAR